MDLPSLRTHPSYQSMRSSLDSLKITAADVDGAPEDPKVMAFLLSFFRSDIDWLEDITTEDGFLLSVDSQKETLINMVTTRVSERCGRSAAPQMTRTWIIPAGETHDEIRFSLREPGLTGDNLGHKTWATSHTVAKLLEVYLQKYLSDFSEKMEKCAAKKISIGSNKCTKPLVLELGSGTGLVGMAAAAIWKTCVVVTDLPEILANLTYNVELNLATIEKAGGNIMVAPLDWSDNRNALSTFSNPSFDVILASDPLYDHQHPYLLADTINEFLERGSGSRALVAIPIRDQITEQYAKKLVKEMEIHGLRPLEEVCEVAQDEDFNAGEAVKVIAYVFGRS